MVDLGNKDFNVISLFFNGTIFVLLRYIVLPNTHKISVFTNFNDL